MQTNIINAFIRPKQDVYITLYRWFRYFASFGPQVSITVLFRPLNQRPVQVTKGNHKFCNLCAFMMWLSLFKCLEAF